MVSSWLIKKELGKYLLVLSILLSGLLLNGVIRKLREAYNAGNEVIEIALGSLPNLIACLLMPLAVVILKSSRSPLREGTQVAIGIMAYEFMQMLIDVAYFDPYDLVFSLIGLLGFFLLIRMSSPRGLLT